VNSIHQGGDLRYTILVTNPHSYPLTGVVITDVVPGYTNYNPAITNPPVNPPVRGVGGDVLTWPLGTLGPGQVTVITLGLHVYLNHPVGVLTNTVYGRSDQEYFIQASAWVTVTPRTLSILNAPP